MLNHVSSAAACCSALGAGESIGYQAHTTPRPIRHLAAISVWRNVRWMCAGLVQGKAAMRPKYGENGLPIPPSVLCDMHAPGVLAASELLKASRIHRSILQGISSSLLSQSAVQAKCGLASHGRSFGIVRCAPDMRRPKFAALQFTQKYSQKQESPMQPKYSTIFKTTLYFFIISTYSYPSGS